MDVGSYFLCFNSAEVGWAFAGCGGWVMGWRWGRGRGWDLEGRVRVRVSESQCEPV